MGASLVSAAAQLFSPVCLHGLLDSPHIDPAATALTDGARRWSHARLRLAVWGMAQRLLETGVQRGERVGVLLPKSLEECAALFAPSVAGAVVVPLNPVLKAAQIRHVLADCEARVLITRRSLLAQVDEISPSLPGLRVLLVDDDGTGVPAADAETFVDSDAACPVPWPTGACIGADLAAILYTSGSTGSPKGVMLTHSNLLAGTRIVRQYLGLTAQDRILSVLPFSFDYGLNQLLTAIEQGAHLVLSSFQLGDQLVRQLAEHRITGLAGVPTIWAILTRAAPSLLRTPLPSLRYITNSGGAVPEATVRKLRELLPSTQVFLMYGLTEAFRSTFLPPSEVDHRPTSIGKAIPECEVFVLTADGRRAAPGEHGVLVHRGPTVSMGYWRRPEDTARVLKPHPLRPAVEGGETVCFSGDLAYTDEDGFIYFVGRQDAMIKSAGYRISPSEVEDALMSSGAFRQVAAVGVPDPWVGQRVVAVAVSSGQGPDVAAVLAAVAQQLPGHMVPARIELVDSLPVTPNGKVDYKALVAERSVAAMP